MSQTLTIARRELTSIFFSPIGYVVLGLFAIATTLIFFLWFQPDQPANMQISFWWVVWFMIFLLPATSMRLLSEEYRSGTIETLMTSPISDAQVICGKWLGVMGFLLILSLPLWLQALVIELNGAPDPGPLLTGFLGLLLVGALYLAIGACASAATENQVNAFLVTVAIISLFTFVTRFLPYADVVKNNDFLRNTMFFANINDQFDTFNRGLIDTSNIVFFVSATILFLFLAVMLLQSKRWR